MCLSGCSLKQIPFKPEEVDFVMFVDVLASGYG